MDLFDVAVTTDEEGGRPAVKVVGLGDFFVELVGLSGDEDGVGEAVALDESVRRVGFLS